MSLTTWNSLLRAAEEIDRDYIIHRLLLEMEKMRKRTSPPLWSIVGDALSHGSGVSSALCSLYGVNPDTGKKIEGWRHIPKVPGSAGAHTATSGESAPEFGQMERNARKEAFIPRSRVEGM